MYVQLSMCILNSHRQHPSCTLGKSVHPLPCPPDYTPQGWAGRPHPTGINPHNSINTCTSHKSITIHNHAPKTICYVYSPEQERPMYV